MAENKSYSDKLKDPRWQKKRLEIFNRDNFMCKCCSSTDKTLHVHHKVYIKNAQPWEYENNYLITLCHDCHEIEENAKNSIEQIINDFLLAGGDYSMLSQIIWTNKERLYNERPSISFL